VRFWIAMRTGHERPPNPLAVTNNAGFFCDPAITVIIITLFSRYSYAINALDARLCLHKEVECLCSILLGSSPA
jgi:hypothetical protein